MIEIEKFGKFCEKDICLFKLKNDFLEIGILNFGGIIKYFNVKMPGEDKNIVFGIEDLDEYFREGNYSSAIIGRVANRIKYGKFTLNKNEYEITKNDGEHCNHGGVEGFDKKIFDYCIDGDVLRLLLLSNNGDQGFGGNLTLTVEYYLEQNSLKVQFIAKSDEDTVFAPTYHPYFNLLENSQNIYDTKLKINSKFVALLDEEGFSKQELKNITDTVFDFSEFRPLGEAVLAEDEQIKFCGGLDHCYKTDEDYVASAYNAKSKIRLDVFSDMPGVQIYTTNDYAEEPRNSRFYKHCAFCLEPQFFPDAVNVDGFEKPILLAEKPQKYYIEYKISVKEESI